MIEKLMQYELVWEQDPEDTVFFKTEVSGNEFSLKMNDFPSEPMYTVWILGEKFDFDDLPEKWTLSYKTKFI